MMLGPSARCDEAITTATVLATDYPDVGSAATTADGRLAGDNLYESCAWDLEEWGEDQP